MTAAQSYGLSGPAAAVRDLPYGQPILDPSARLHSYRYFPYPGLRMPAPHVHNDIELNLVVSGQATYLFGARHLTVHAGDLCVFWAAIPHQLIQLDAATRYFALHLPLDYFMQRHLPPAFTQQILRGEPSMSNTVADAQLQLALFERWHRYVQTGNADYRRAVLLEIEATLRYLALSAPAAAHEDERLPIIAGSDEVEAMVQVITRRFQEPLSVAQVAEAVSLHPNYAMQLFRQYTGRTIVRYLNQYRIAHAQQLLLTSDKSVLDIAYESGFSSLSRFYAVFRQTCNTSPGRYRQALGARG